MCKELNRTIPHYHNLALPPPDTQKMGCSLLLLLLLLYTTTANKQGEVVRPVGGNSCRTVGVGEWVYNKQQRNIAPPTPEDTDAWTYLVQVVLELVNEFSLAILQLLIHQETLAARA